LLGIEILSTYIRIQKKTINYKDPYETTYPMTHGTPFVSPRGFRQREPPRQTPGLSPSSFGQKKSGQNARHSNESLAISGFSRGIYLVVSNIFYVHPYLGKIPFIAVSGSQNIGDSIAISNV